MTLFLFNSGDAEMPGISAFIFSFKPYLICGPFDKFHLYSLIHAATPLFAAAAKMVAVKMCAEQL